MSLKCCMTLSPMSMTRTVAPSCSDTMMALDFVRSVVPKHGMVTAEGPMPELKVGDMLEAIPVHICPTVNLQNQIYVADGGVLRTEIVAGRGKLQ